MSSIFHNSRDDDKGKISKKGSEEYEKKINILLEESLLEIEKIRTYLERNHDSDIFRDVLVRLSSLIDFFFSEIMKYIVPTIFRNSTNLPSEWNAFEVPMKDIRRIVDDWDTEDLGGKWIEDAYYNSYYENSNQALRNIKKVFALIKNNCFKDFVNKHESTIKKNLDDNKLSISQMISNLYKKRNVIVHSYDYRQNKFPKRNTINKDYLLKNLDFFNELFINVSEYITLELAS